LSQARDAYGTGSRVEQGELTEHCLQGRPPVVYATGVQDAAGFILLPELDVGAPRVDAEKAHAFPPDSMQEFDCNADSLAHGGGGINGS